MEGLCDQRRDLSLWGRDFFEDVSFVYCILQCADFLYCGIHFLCFCLFVFSIHAFIPRWPLRQRPDVVLAGLSGSKIDRIKYF